MYNIWLLLINICSSCNFLTCRASVVTLSLPGRLPFKENNYTSELLPREFPGSHRFPGSWQCSFLIWFPEEARFMRLCRPSLIAPEAAGSLQNSLREGVKRFVVFFFFPKFISQMDRSLERRRQVGETIGLAAASWAMGTWIAADEPRPALPGGLGTQGAQGRLGAVGGTAKAPGPSQALLWAAAVAGLLWFLPFGFLSLFSHSAFLVCSSWCFMVFCRVCVGRFNSASPWVCVGMGILLCVEFAISGYKDVALGQL